MKVLSTSRWPPVQDVRLGWSLIFGSRNAVPGTSGVGVVVVRDVSIVQRLSSESRQQMQWLKYWCWEPTGLCGSVVFWMLFAFLCCQGRCGLALCAGLLPRSGCCILESTR